ncbi:hypothetical protein OG21DRAFT_1254306 [Imleria badia]|nr:hypothetical protein OG21DRAFT_1254306 [Imleria badia]
MGPLHPRVLTIAQRELIIWNGLRDDEPTVRIAAGSVLRTWVDVVRRGPQSPRRMVPSWTTYWHSLACSTSTKTLSPKTPFSAYLPRASTFSTSSSSKGGLLGRINTRKGVCGACNAASTASPPMTKLEATLPVVTHRIRSMYNKRHRFRRARTGIARARRQ